MLFSLVLATKNRVFEVERFLESLANQSYQNFELIIIDQNPDDRLVSLVQFYCQKISIEHLKQPEPGSSKARNRGRSHINGDLVAFPDDDCLYPPDLLAQVKSFFNHNQTEQNVWDGIIARAFDIDEDKNAFLYCGDDNSGIVDLERACQIGITFTMFFRAHVVKAVAFDETLGPGSGTPWPCGDDTNYLLRCVKSCYKIYYNANLIVRHPNPFKIYSFSQIVRRQYGYGRGNGYLLSQYFPEAFMQSRILPDVPYIFSTLFTGQPDYSAYIIAYVVGMLLGYWDNLRRPKSNRSIDPSTLGQTL